MRSDSGEILSSEVSGIFRGFRPNYVQCAVWRRVTGGTVVRKRVFDLVHWPVATARFATEYIIDAAANTREFNNLHYPTELCKQGRAAFSFNFSGYKNRLYPF